MTMLATIGRLVLRYVPASDVGALLASPSSLLAVVNLGSVRGRAHI